MCLAVPARVVELLPQRRARANLDGLELVIESGGNSIRPAKGSIALMEPAAADLSHAPVVKTSPAGLSALTATDVAGKALAIEIPGETGFGGMRRAIMLAAKLQPALIILPRSGGRGMNANPRLRDLPGSSPVPVLAVGDPAIRAALNSGPITISAHIAAPAVAPVKLRNVIGVLRGADPALHAEQFKIVNVANNEELAAVGV